MPRRENRERRALAFSGPGCRKTNGPSSCATGGGGGAGGRPFRVGKTRNINNQAAGAHRRLRSVIGETRIDVPFSPTSLKSKPSQLLDFCFFAASYKLKPNNSFSPFHP
ncbi:hypothetical protein PVAP13_4KG290200 [Panicum virgatum]|uniref:Uncharacterized protein n=1 Tax=Panicum virgatum TaxID=38727 RepID=A0A8T0TRS0_PANVG|nr:hypothetical protein PVAP13_4KG290200 [Panicum virgatum]